MLLVAATSLQYRPFQLIFFPHNGIIYSRLQKAFSWRESQILEIVSKCFSELLSFPGNHSSQQHFMLGFWPLIRVIFMCLEVIV